MQNRVVEIASTGAYISISRGFLCIKLDGDMAGQIAIEDMSALIIRGYGAALSVNVCSRLSEANVPVVICSSDQSPASIIWPVSGHFSQGLHMQAQAVANKPLNKRLWAQLVRAKVIAQADVLESYSLNGKDLRAMAQKVKSGDPSNVEAQAARRYWPRLMGDEFKRGKRTGFTNIALNYGYTVLRASVARSILAAGLHPSLSIHHQSKGDPLRLADDLMEPFRPWVDHIVRNMTEVFGAKSDDELEPQHKTNLAAVLTIDMQSSLGTSPLQICIDRVAQSLVQVFLGEQRTLDLPGPPILVSG